jgi:hypothetical protein
MGKIVQKPFLFTCLLLGVGIPLISLAQIEIQNPLKARTFEDLVIAIATFLWNIALGIAPIMVIIAGFLFVTGGGDPAKLQRAKQILLYTVIGIVIIGISRGLLVVLKNFFLK